ncbi:MULTISPECIES: hypothetical protein [unclassified Shewanella]|uniref:hypothetical protein n=1 Tax=unclassified Shewanella TaxID=196818 RepID=UPI0005A05805|nr:MULTISPECIES: hypothetical protein [unclassified Shewanella]KIO35696.1 hypothetical protein DB48_15545 [Shewanella sp. cp20]MCG9721803.1 hypothetical protein [Shewanella sp. Isolate7]
MKKYTTGLGLVLLGLSIGFSPLTQAKNDKHEHGAKGHVNKSHGEKSLPPGLQKKVARGEPLPPGWQKKLHKGDYLSDDYYDRGKIHVPIDRDGNITIDVDGTFIKLHDKTRRILDIIND